MNHIVIDMQSLPQSGGIKIDEDWAQFRLALLNSDFDEWATACPVKAAALISSVYADKIEEAKIIFATISESHPPTTDQLQRWQAIADRNNIQSIKFI